MLVAAWCIIEFSLLKENKGLGNLTGFCFCDAKPREVVRAVPIARDGEWRCFGGVGEGCGGRRGGEG